MQVLYSEKCDKQWGNDGCLYRTAPLTDSFQETS